MNSEETFDEELSDDELKNLLDENLLDEEVGVGRHPDQVTGRRTGRRKAPKPRGKDKPDPKPEPKTQKTANLPHETPPPPGFKRMLVYSRNQKFKNYSLRLNPEERIEAQRDGFIYVVFPWDSDSQRLFRSLGVQLFIDQKPIEHKKSFDGIMKKDGDPIQVLGHGMTIEGETKPYYARAIAVTKGDYTVHLKGKGVMNESTNILEFYVFWSEHKIGHLPKSINHFAKLPTDVEQEKEQYQEAQTPLPDPDPPSSEYPAENPAAVPES